MKSPRIFSPANVIGALSLFLLPAAQGIAQTTATTDPVGYAQTACLANTDTKLSLPFSRPAEFVGAIGSITGSTITVASTPNWTTNQYVFGSNTSTTPGETSKTYYAIIGPNITALASAVGVTNGGTTVTGSGLGSIVAGDELLVNGLAYNVVSVATDGNSLVIDRAYMGTTATGLSASYDHSPKEGSFYTVTANGSNTVTITLNGDSLGAVATGTTVSLIPYWTIGTAFPPADAGTSYTISSTPATSARGTQILLPDLVTMDINLSPSAPYYYYNSAWRKVGVPLTTPLNDTLLLPSTYFILRNTATATTFTPSGGVYMNRVVAQLDSSATTAVDNAVAVPRPTNVTLNDLGLISTGAFASSANSSIAARKDQLLVYDNAATGINKSSVNTYYSLNGKWQKAGGSLTVDSGSTVISYGTGFTVRKAVSNPATTTFWQNTRNY